MKILKITFRNINSLRAQRTIDFEASPLADVGLFAITGDTGAGKTTILDAMTLALYGKVHRNKQVADVMSYGAGESLAEVEFSTHGKRYLATWRLRKARGKADGNPQPVKRSLAEWEEEAKAFRSIAQKVAAVDKKVEELSGLDFTRFCRSVLLSQGDFAAFLKAKEGERSELLERITGTAIYSELSKAAYVKYKEEEQKLMALKESLGNIDILSQEEVDALIKVSADKTTTIAELKRKLGHWQAKENAYQQLHLLAKEGELLQLEIAKIKADKERLLPDFKRLNAYETIRHLLPLLSQLENAEKELATRTQEQEDVNIQLTKAQQEVIGLAEEVEKGKREWLEIDHFWKSQQIIFEQVLEQDNWINNANNAYREKQALYQQITKESLQYTAEANQLKQTIKELQTKLKKGDEWLVKNAVRKELVEELASIRLVYEQQNNASKELVVIEKELKALQGVVEEHQIAVESGRTQLQLEQEKYQKAVKQFEIGLSTLGIVNDKEVTTKLEQEYKEGEHRIERLQQLEQITTIAKELAAQKEVLCTEIDKLALREKQLLKDKTKAAFDLKEAVEHLALQEAIYMQQQKIAAYEEHRAHLKEGDECPLCFSTVHDLSQHTRPFEDKIKENYDKAKLAKIAAEKAVQELDVAWQKVATARKLQVDRLEKEVSVQIKANNDAIVRLQKQLLDIDGGSLEEVVAKQKMIAQLLKAKQEVDSLERHYQQGQIATQKLETTYQLTKEKQQQLVEHQSKRQGEYAAAHQAYAAFLEKYGLAENDTPTTFESRRNTYEEQKDKREATHAELNLLQEKELYLVSQIATLQEREKEQEKELLERKDAILVAETARKKLFGDKQVKEEKATLEKQHKQCHQAYLNSQQRYQQIVTRIEVLTKQQEEKEHYVTLAQSTFATQNNEWMEALSQAGFETRKEVENRILPREEVEELTQQREELHTRQTTLEAKQDSWLVTKTKTEEVLEDKDTAEEVYRHRKELSQAIDSHLMEKGEIDQRLKANETVKKTIAAYETQILQQEASCSRWGKLNEIIGQADGKKFRTFAQGLTLQRLVYNANEYLKYLNDRYHLYKSPTEDLQIEMIDNWQAGNQRPIATLSGGESFLVSLALALGLSDMAGRNTNIQSLFIDEGFGSLDMNSLDAAISTLENLQSMGKTIGVISHVATLKERISTQIQVIKSSSGVSEIVIQ